MTRDIIILLCIFLLLCAACEKQKTTIIPDIQNPLDSIDNINPFDTLLIWKIEDGFKSPGYLKLYEDLIVTSKEPVLGQTIVSAYKSECGELEWESFEYITHSKVS